MLSTENRKPQKVNSKSEFEERTKYSFTVSLNTVTLF